MTDASGKRKRESTDCPYLDTINRSLLDFDLEPSCSVSLESGPHIYSCCVCGKFFRGRGPSTPLYVHAVEESHYVVVHLQTTRFYCLPDDYEIIDSSLNDIAHALNPTYTESIIQNIDTNTTLSRDLFGRRYLPGFVGLNNLNKTDCVNAIVQALAHVPPLRDFFLRQRERQLPASSSSKASLPTIRQALQVTQAFGALIRKIWSHQRFKHHVDPHMLVQAISKASNKKFGAGQQAEVGEMLTFILHQLHLGCGGKIKKKANKSSIVQQTFQGKLRVTTRRKKAMKVIETDITHDDRAGSGDEDESMKQEDAKEQEEIEETTMESHFLQLTLDIPEKPLFRDEDGGLVIPQEPFVNVLKKFDGMTFSEAVHKGMAERKKYELLELPNYLILHLARFNNNRYSREKNPTIVAFPAKNLDLSSYVHGGNVKVPSEEEVRNMSIKELKCLLRKHGQNKVAESAVEKNELVGAAIDFVVKSLPDLLADKYDLVANITHESPAEVGREGTYDPLQVGSYKCHVQHRGTKQWYEMQDLHVREVMTQQIGLSESYLLIFERQSSRPPKSP